MLDQLFRVNNGKCLFIMTPPCYWKMFFKDKMTIEEFFNHFNACWGKEFPEWETKPLYCIEYDEPQKICTFEEFKNQNPHIKEEYLQSEYDKMEPKESLMVPRDSIDFKDKE